MEDNTWMLIPKEGLETPRRENVCLRSRFPVDDHCLTYEDLLPLAGLQLREPSGYLLPQVTPSTLIDGVGSQKTDARKKEQICFGMVRR